MQRLLTHPYAFLASEPMALYDTLYGVTALLFAAAIPFVWRRFGAAYGLFMLLNLYVPLSSGAFEGLGRYCSVLFPGVHLAGLDSIAIRLHLAGRRIRALLYARPRAVRDGPSAVLGTEGWDLGA